MSLQNQADSSSVEDLGYLTTSLEQRVNRYGEKVRVNYTPSRSVVELDLNLGSGFSSFESARVVMTSPGRYSVEYCSSKDNAQKTFAYEEYKEITSNTPVDIDQLRSIRESIVLGQARGSLLEAKANAKNITITRNDLPLDEARALMEYFAGVFAVKALKYTHQSPVEERAWWQNPQN
jgi:hypothetical protein